MPGYLNSALVRFINVADDPPTDLNTVVFKLDVKCENNPTAAPDHVAPNKKYINSSGNFSLT